VLEAYRGVPARMKNVQLHIFPGVQHGYMMRGNSKAFDPVTYDFSMGRALAILEGLRSAENDPRAATAPRSGSSASAGL
jgi:carboxymethylenebutenolidase